MADTIVVGSQKSPAERSWFIARRWQEFDGELRSALLRGILVTVFYFVQLVNHLSLQQQTDADRSFHRLVTLVAIVWLLLSLAVLVSLRGGFMPPILKFLTSGCDLVLTTTLAYFGQGAQSPLVYAFFVILTLSALRFSLSLVWFSTIGSLLAYLFLVGASDPTWFSPDHATPILTQSLVLLSLASSGVVLGQLTRSVRTMAVAYNDRLLVAQGSDKL